MFKIKINTTPEKTETTLDFLRKYTFYNNCIHDLQEGEYDPKTQSCGIRFTVNTEDNINNIIRDLLKYGLVTEKEIRNCVDIRPLSQNPDVSEHSNMTVKKMNKIREEIEDRGGFISPGSESLWALGMLCAFAKDLGIEPTISSFFEEMEKLYSETNVSKKEC